DGVDLAAEQARGHFGGHGHVQRGDLTNRGPRHGPERSACFARCCRRVDPAVQSIQLATVTRRLERVLHREAPSWGIRPVPAEYRRLRGLDFAVLWGDLSVGLLVLLTGALLVPALGFRSALLAIVVGSILGTIPLALVGLAGAREGVPGMVLFRPVLGLRGSYLPSVLNIVQLVG